MKKINNTTNLMAEMSRTAQIKKNIPDLKAYTVSSVRALNKALEDVNKNYTSEERIMLERANDALETAINNLKLRQAARQVQLRKVCRKLALAGIGEEIVITVMGRKFTCVEQGDVDALLKEARELLKENNLLEEEARENASQKAAKAAINADYAELLNKEEDNLVYSEGILISEASNAIKDYDLDGKAALLIYKDGRLPNGQRPTKEDADWAIGHLRNKGLIGKPYWSLDGFGISRKIAELGEWAQKESVLYKKFLSEEDLAARKELVTKIFADKNSDKILSSICNYNYMIKDGRVVINFEKAEAIRDTLIRGKEKTDLLNKVWFVQAAYDAGYNVGDPYIVLRGAFKMFLDPDLMERREAARAVISDYLNKADQEQAWAAFRSSRILWASNELINLGFDAENEDRLEEALKDSMNSEMSQDDMYWLISELKNHQEFFKNIPDDFGGRQNAKANKFDDPTLQYWRGNKEFMEAMEAEFLDRVKVGYDYANWSFCFARALMFANTMPNDFEEFEYSKKLQAFMKPILAKYKTLFSGKRVLCKATKVDILNFYEEIKSAFVENWLDLSPDQKMLLKALGESVIPTIRNCTDETSVSTYRWKQISASQVPSLETRGYEVRKTIVTKEEECAPYEKVIRVPSKGVMVEAKRIVTTKVTTSTKYEVKVVDHIESDLDLMIDGIYTIYHWLQVSPERWRNCKSITRVLETGLMYGPARENYKNDKDDDFGLYFLSLTREDGSERDIAAVDLYGNPLESEEFDNCF